MNVWLKRAAQIGLTVAVAWFIVDRVGVTLADIEALPAGAWVPEIGPLIAASAVLLLGYLLSGALWGRIVSDLGGPSLAASESAGLFMIANLGRYIPGKIWQIAGLAAIAKTRGVEAVTATSSAVIGQGLALLAAGTIGGVAFLGAQEPYRTIGIVALATAGAFVLGLAIPPVRSAVARLWFRLAKSEGPEEVTGGAAMSWFALYAVNWLIYAASFWIFSGSLVPGGPLIPVASAFAAAYVVGYLWLPAPAGLGPREAVLIAFLTPHYGAGQATVVAVVARLWTTLVEVIPAGLFWSRYLGGDVDRDEQGRGA